MAWNWLERKRQEAGEWTGFLDRGVLLDGTLRADGTLRIDCNMKGRIVSGGTLVLGEHALVEGDIDGNIVLVGGRFSGKIRATSRVAIQPNAIVTGDIQTPCLMIEPGGVFDGQCLIPSDGNAVPALTIPVRSVSLANEVPA